MRARAAARCRELSMPALLLEKHVKCARAWLLFLVCAARSAVMQPVACALLVMRSSVHTVTKCHSVRVCWPSPHLMSGVAPCTQRYRSGHQTTGDPTGIPSRGAVQPFERRTRHTQHTLSNSRTRTIQNGVLSCFPSDSIRTGKRRELGCRQHRHKPAMCRAPVR